MNCYYYPILLNNHALNFYSILILSAALIVEVFILLRLGKTVKEGNAKDFDELLYKLEDAGYEIKRGKYVSLRGKEQKRFIRLRSLGNGYTEDDLKKILAGEMERAFYNNEKAEKQPKTYQRKRKTMSLTFLFIFKRSWLRAKENIMSALPRTLIQSM